jgi:hypothetical protein
MVKASMKQSSWRPVTDVAEHDHRAWRGDRILYYQQV